MESLYKDGNDWILNGSPCPDGIYMLGQDQEWVNLIAVESGQRIGDYARVTDIDKNAIGDKYSDVKEFREATKLFFEKLRVNSGFLPIIGQSEGSEYVFKFGANPQILPNSDPEDIIEQGGTYFYDDYGTAPIQFISSSNNSDNQLIMITGLDVDGYQVVQFATLDGRNNVTLTTPLWRLFSFQTAPFSATRFLGTVYCHTDTAPVNGVPAIEKIRGMASAENQRTLLAIYTIPKGKIGYIHRGEVGIEKAGNAAATAEYARFAYKGRALNGVFVIEKRVTVMVATGVYQDVRPFPNIIPALTDVKIEVQEVSEDMGVWASFDIRLVDENMIPTPYLEAVGQPV